MKQPLQKLVRVRVDFSGDSEQDVFTGHGYTEDLTTNGCQIETSTMVPPGRYVTLRVYRPKAAEPIQVELACVRWGDGRKLGVEFIRANGSSRNGVGRLVSSPDSDPVHEQPADTGEKPTSLTILLVDDNPDARALYSKVLTDAGHRVLEASSSIEAMQLCLNSIAIDLVIVDVILTVPELRPPAKTALFCRVNGPQLIQDMLAVRKQVRALIISALDAKRLKNYGVVLGAIPFLQKPFVKKQLLNSIATVGTLSPLVWTAPSPNSECEQQINLSDCYGAGS
jgi:CheY-like chemotaxis protein